MSMDMHMSFDKRAGRASGYWFRCRRVASARGKGPTSHRASLSTRRGIRRNITWWNHITRLIYCRYYHAKYDVLVTTQNFGKRIKTSA